jgi:hypothetical protein
MEGRAVSEEMIESHRRQIDEGVRASLTLAGIPPEVFNLSLTNVEGGEALVQWVKSEAKAFFLSGGVVNFIGSKPSAPRAMYLLARALHLSGIGVRVTSTPRLLAALVDADEDYLRWANNSSVLVMPRFYVPDDPQDKPFTPWQTMLVETFLTERKSAGKGLLINGYRPLPGMVNPSWWRRDFRMDLGSVVKDVEISE